MFITLFICYVVGAFATWVCMMAAEELGDTAGPQDVAVWLFWPIFAVKYLAIGLWLVVVSGYNLLMEK